MGASFVGNSLWHLIRQADGTSKLVLLILLGMSVMCWAVFLCKAVLVFLKRRQCKKMNKQLTDVVTLEGAVSIATQHTKTMPGYLLSKNLLFLKLLLNGKTDGQQEKLSQYEWETMQQHVDQTLDMMIAREESYLSILSTSAAVAPLLGLFGTVWGLVHSFMRISEKQVADIATIAPGIAEALISTLAGLMVAIPELVMFNYLQVQIRSIEQDLISVTDKIRLMIQALREPKGVYHATNHASSESSASAQ